VLRSPQHADYDAYGALHTELRVSLNGADYEDNASTPFEFYHPPGGFSLSPNTGPSQGGISVHISDAEMAKRRAAFVPPPYKYTRGTMYRYIKTVSSAQHGCVTDE
jgi:hypothetical protein